MKKLGFGAMRLPLLDSDDITSFDIDHLTKMIDSFLKNGFTYFDTAFIYHRGKSESVLGDLLVSRYDRSAFQLATKLPIWLIKEEGDKLSLFNKQLSRCKTDFFDYYMLHSINRGSYETIKQFNCFDFGWELKNQGKIKNFGFSFHDTPDLLEEIFSDLKKSKNPMVDFVMLQINYFDWDNPAIASRQCYEIARKYGVPIVVMEPVKGGNLASLPSEAGQLFKNFNPSASAASWALRYATAFDGVFMTLSGMSNMEQLNDNMATFLDFKPLSEREKEVLEKVKIILHGEDAIACTYCGYCVESCPKNIAIPDYFSLYNDIKKNPKAIIPGNYYNTISKKRGKASECVACKLCHPICPQKLDISKGLSAVASVFEPKKD
ncbi:MAG: aldo/keto reductase [Firmicutes bacterium]|nr:aldo/keto reductase [Bacillota bacterium]